MRPVPITILFAALFTAGMSVAGILPAGMSRGRPYGMSPGRPYTITVHIVGLRSDRGKLYLSLYHSASGYPKNPSAAFRLSSAPLSGKMGTVILDALPGGVYAIACYHDENDNGKLDSNLFGIPTEGTGASNNARGSWGPPKFRDAAFTLNSDTTLTVKMVY
jgi:uncharacterized protein (DUF2141 family)